MVSATTTTYPSTTFSSSTTTTTTSYASTAHIPLRQLWMGLTINGLSSSSSSSFIKCNGYGQTYCVDNIGGSTCQTRCSINIPNNQFHVNGQLQTSNIVEISSPNETKEMDDLGSSSSSSSLYVPTVL
ncbi:hypothetical protein ACTFIR_007238 [Dictyostelium discoideum]